MQSEHTASAIKLSFYDHYRQSYGHLPLRDGAAAEFMIGDYGHEESGVGWGGEFCIVLKRLQDGRGGYELVPQLQVFGDATKSLKAAIGLGLLEAMDAVRDRDEFTERLTAMGLRDRSALPVGSPAPVCPHCGSERRV